jgi:spore cortex formation protein SpoVR/YcgB (stage V sporulation)
MENNPDLIQKLVIAHACFGHNHFFKNNYLFSSVNILPYSEYARDFINECRSKYGEVEVDQVLDNCLILQWFGVDENSNYNFGDFLKTRIKHKFQDSWELDYLTPLSNNIEEIKTRNVIDTFKNRENLLDIFSVYSELDPWKKEIISIISTFSKFFWKNILTKVINEGFASFIHYKIMNEMQLSQSEHLQFLDTHTSVVSQQEFGPAYKINPYYLGFHILMELEKTKGLDFIVNNVVKNYRDDNFIEQFLSKELMEDKLKLMMAVKHASEDDSILYKVTEIQDDDGFSILKKTLINELSYNNWKPEVLIDSINTINHSIKIKLSNKGAILNLSKLKNSLKALWGEGEVSFI